MQVAMGVEAGGHGAQAVRARQLRVNHRDKMGAAAKALVIGIAVMAGHDRLERLPLQRLEKRRENARSSAHARSSF
jgi:hypothetical protein